MIADAEQPVSHQLFPFWRSFFWLFKKSNIILLKLYQKSWSIHTAYFNVVRSKDRQTSQDRSLWLWSKKGTGEKELTLLQVLPKNILLCLLWSYTEPQMCTWVADLSLSLLISDAILLSCHLFSREIACSALAGGISFGVTPTRWHFSSLSFMGWYQTNDCPNSMWSLCC